MFLLTTAHFPQASELYDWSPADLVEFGSPRLFATVEAAFAAAEADILDGRYDEDEADGGKLRMLDDVQVGESYTRAYGYEDTTPEDGDFGSFCFAYVRPIAVEG